jgi:hypothetical protein
MAWRIHESVVRGEIDCRVKDRVTGRIWLVGVEEPVQLNLRGNPWRDLAGHWLTFTNTNPQPGHAENFAMVQNGTVGDMTASRKVKVPDLPIEEIMRLAKAGEPWPWHWANCLYLEWFSERNGRVVVESTDYQIEIDAEATWVMDEEMEKEQCLENAMALTNFMDVLCQAVSDQKERDASIDDEDDDAPQSSAEALADAEDDYMNRLLDRIDARMKRDGLSDMEDYDRIYEEERTRLRREMGFPPDPEPTPEQLEQQQRWIEEMNALGEEALREMEAETWRGNEERKRPALVARASDLGVQLHDDVDLLLPPDPLREHPLLEIVNGVCIASAKLAGALGCEEDEEDWPPDPLYAGGTLVRLKKARAALRDALRGLDSADEENLGTADWRSTTRGEINAILVEVQRLIKEVRDVLADGDDTGDAPPF